MAKFKTVKFKLPSDEAAIEMSVCISVEGHFYVSADNMAAPVSQMLHNNETVAYVRSRGRTRFEADSFEVLNRALMKAVSDAYQPEVSEEQVIRYLIGSDATYAVNHDTGELRPFAGDGYQWPKGSRNCNYSYMDGSKGYRVGIGAVAYTKTTTRYPDGTVKHDYDRYYGVGDHLRAKCPASWLNSWNHTGFNNRGEIFGEKVHEIPYSDDAALFFHDMMHGLCEIAKRLDDYLGAPEKAQQFISENAGVKLLK